MRFFVGAIALLAGSAVAQECNCDCVIDDCFAVVAGTSPFPAEPTVSDCRSFMWTVITVAASTITTTAVVSATATNTVEETKWTTITVTTEQVLLQKRQATGVTVPDYATAACGAPSDFSSACRCLGITAGGTSYHQVPGTETVTVTETASATIDQTVTVTATESAAATMLYFKIRAADVLENGQWRGQYLYTTDEGTGTPPNRRLTFVNSASQGLTFRAGPDNLIVGSEGTPIVGDGTYDVVKEQVYLQEPIQDQVAYTCTFSPSDKGVSCQYTGNGKNYVYLTITNGGVLWLFNSTAQIAAEEPVNGAVGPIVLEAVPA
ncbi:hypothetical protein TWF281_002927 [Arthrobotrys megalospora]